MQSKYLKAFTLVEMLMALAVSSIIIGATYSSYQIVANQYNKNLDVAQMHTSGRAIMRIIKRDVRMAGFEYRDNTAVSTYGAISDPLVITDSGDACCDAVTVIYDKEENQQVKRIQITYSTAAYSNNKGVRHRLYKQTDILGQGGLILASPIIGASQVMADYIEDLQIARMKGFLYYTSGDNTIAILNTQTGELVNSIDISNTSKIGTLAFGADGLLYVGGDDKISIFNIISNTLVEVGTILTGEINSMAFGLNGLLYVSSGDNTIKVFDTINGGQLLDIINDGKIGALTFGTDGILYVGSDNTKKINYYDTINNAWKTGDFQIDTSIQVGALAFGADGLLYVGDISATGGGNTIEICDINTYECLNPLANTDAISTLAFDSDGLLYSGSRLTNDKFINIFNTASNTKVGTLDTAGAVDALAFRNTDSDTEFLVNINLTLRGKYQHNTDRRYTKKPYQSGNFQIDKTDKYRRDTFSTTVLVRNLAL